MKKDENGFDEKNETQSKEIFNEQEKEWITNSEYNFYKNNYNGNYFLLNLIQLNSANNYLIQKASSY